MCNTLAQGTKKSPVLHRVCASDKLVAPRAVPSQQGPNGTFNYLIDAVLDVPATRAMYLRRLRSLMDYWLGGRIEQVGPAP